MRFEKTELEGVRIVEATPAGDERGYFARTFCEREFDEAGLHTRFVQHSRSCSLLKGTLRGMHFQAEPMSEIKLVSCVRGAVYDVVVDLRRDSSTYRRWMSVELTEANQRQVYIPEGCAHGFMTLCDEVVVNYLISAFYRPELARGIRYDDPAIGVEWPAPPTVISQKDLNWPLVADEIPRAGQRPKRAPAARAL